MQYRSVYKHSLAKYMNIFLYNVLKGVSPVFWKKPMLRVCRILYNFSDNPVTNENPKTHARIGMYKMVHRLIKRKKANPL
ncbi:hypothetical protein COK06_25815 [Bacillus cereus]|nr:hypothetical protein CON40_01780 [Bacillus cereus]PFE58543.1 hypothetical protein CN318_00065 [Bacillus cereus]PFI35028.1 hypothetical protein COI72_23330 [Bacillus cereus]PFI97797.1 hypothetical protein COI88_26575 [Bacillus cereus]PFP88739.1 hypothetical protein COK06_25815 [Bacillus cereus]